MSRPVTLTLTGNEAEQISIAAIAALNDEEFSRPTLASVVHKLASAKPQRRPRRLFRYGARVLVVAGLLLVVLAGPPLLTPTAQTPAVAASPFTLPPYMRAVEALEMTCAEAAPRVHNCTLPDSTEVRIEAHEGPDGLTFVSTFHAGGQPQRNEFRLFYSTESVARVLAAAAANPQAFPNLRSGDRWVITGTFPYRFDVVATAFG